ncbi:MAG: hypothetical protein P1V97_25835 [Planctomycetota bacterium]|nr:hypothetical protein [Planctomycetota bacterium]
MTQTETKKLDAGDLFPAMSLSLASGDTLALPTKKWSVLLFYRGLW